VRFCAFVFSCVLLQNDRRKEYKKNTIVLAGKAGRAIMQYSQNGVKTGMMLLMSTTVQKTIIPWKRFWCRFGDAIHVGEDRQGFLTDPEGELFTRLHNPHLFTFDKLLNEKCLILCGDPGTGKSTVLQQAKSALENSLGADGKLIWLEFRDVPSESAFARRTFESDGRRDSGRA